MTFEAEFGQMLQDLVFQVFGGPVVAGIVLLILFFLIAMALRLPSVILVGVAFFLVLALTEALYLPKSILFAVLFAAGIYVAFFVLSWIRR